MHSHIEGFIAAAHLNPDAPADEMLSAVTSVIQVEGHKFNWIRVQLYEGAEPYSEDGQEMLIELPPMVWPFVLRHVRQAFREAFSTY